MINRPPHSVEDAENAIMLYADMVYRLAFAQTGSRTNADDVFQETFLRYIQKHPEFQSEEHRKAWLIRVTISKAKDLHRNSWRKNTVPLDADIPASFPEDNGLWDAMEMLSPKDRALIHLFYYEELSCREIAAITGTNSGTVRTRLTRVRKKLKKMIEGDADNDDEKQIP